MPDDEGVRVRHPLATAIAIALFTVLTVLLVLAVPVAVLGGTTHEGGVDLGYDGFHGVSKGVAAADVLEASREGLLGSMRGCTGRRLVLADVRDGDNTADGGDG